MNKLPVVLLSVFALAFAGFAEAAKPKKRTRNANRVGPYAVGGLGQSHFTNDQGQNEQDLVDFINDSGNPVTNVTSETEEKDVGYNATFGYRWTRHFAAELALAQYGSVESIARADMDFGSGPVPVSVKLAFSAGGPVISALGFLPLNDKFEFFGRAGYLFASTDREFTTRANGQNGGFGSSKGSSENLVLGVGAQYHFSQVYSGRLEYQKIDAVGEESRSGEEDLSVISIGVVVRF